MYRTSESPVIEITVLLCVKTPTHEIEILVAGGGVKNMPIVDQLVLTYEKSNCCDSTSPAGELAEHVNVGELVMGALVINEKLQR